MGRSGAVSVVLIAVVLAGCGSDSEAKAGDPPPGVYAELFQFRADQANHKLLVGMRNAGPGPVYIRDLQLVSESFKELPPAKIEDEIPRTRRTDVPIPYGAARCDATKIPEVKAAAVIAHLRTGKEKIKKVRLRLPYPNPLLRQILKTECGTYLVNRSIDLRLGDRWTPSKTALQGTLVIKRKPGGQPATITSIGGNPHYKIRLVDTELPYAVPPGDGDLPLRAEIAPARCDPHSFAEAKYAYRYAATAKVGDGEPYSLPFESAGQVRQAIDDFAHKTCGLS